MNKLQVSAGPDSTAQSAWTLAGFGVEEIAEILCLQTSRFASCFRHLSCFGGACVGRLAFQEVIWCAPFA